MTSPTAGEAVDQKHELAVVFSCIWCGKTVEIETGSDHDEIIHAQAFVAEHAECIQRITQPSG